jgi:hypothetical protein
MESFILILLSSYRIKKFKNQDLKLMGKFSTLA